MLYAEHQYKCKVPSKYCLSYSPHCQTKPLFEGEITITHFFLHTTRHSLNPYLEAVIKIPYEDRLNTIWIPHVATSQNTSETLTILAPFWRRSCWRSKFATFANLFCNLRGCHDCATPLRCFLGLTHISRMFDVLVHLPAFGWHLGQVSNVGKYMYINIPYMDM